MRSSSAAARKTPPEKASASAVLCPSLQFINRLGELAGVRMGGGGDREQGTNQKYLYVRGVALAGAHESDRGHCWPTFAVQAPRVAKLWGKHTPGWCGDGVACERPYMQSIGACMAPPKAAKALPPRSKSTSSKGSDLQRTPLLSEGNNMHTTCTQHKHPHTRPRKDIPRGRRERRNRWPVHERLRLRCLSGAPQ